MNSNSVERSIRPIALNRKNALFAGSDGGGGELGGYRLADRNLRALNWLDPGFRTIG